MGEVIWDKPKEVPEWVIEKVDDNVLASLFSLKCQTLWRTYISVELPPGSEVKGIFPHGASYWTRTAAIQTQQADGAPRTFFLKVSLQPLFHTLYVTIIVENWNFKCSISAAIAF